MIWTLALRNLFSDRVRLTVALIGISFAVLLAGIQLGLYLGASKLITAMIDRVGGDLWIMHKGTQSFEEGVPLLGARERVEAAKHAQVTEITPLIVSFGDWVRPNFGLVHVLVVGTESGGTSQEPWALTEGSWEAVRSGSSVAVDQSYLADLGVRAIGDQATIEGNSVKIVALTDGLRSFTQTPYVFMPGANARTVLGLEADSNSYIVLSLAKGADHAAVARELESRMTEVDVITREEFLERSLVRWLMGTGAGLALIGGTILGAIIGIVIVAQILYASTKDHIREYATLRSIGSTTSYLSKVVLAQAGIASTLGFVVGMAGVFGVVELSQNSPLPLAMTHWLVGTLLLFTVLIGAVSAIASVVQIRRADPASLFAR